jgi:sRNA-binding carbon storage regulator CsrA
MCTVADSFQCSYGTVRHASPWRIVMREIIRRPNEAIRVGDEIIIIVRKVNGDQVEIAIESPPGIDVRAEPRSSQLTQGINPGANGAVDESV